MELSGRVKNIIFKNTENGFTVFVLKNDDGNIVCNGTFENLKKNEKGKAKSGKLCYTGLVCYQYEEEINDGKLF